MDDLFAFKRWVGERREGPMAVDTESSGLSPHREVLRLVQFGDKHHGWAIPWDLWKGAAIEVIRDYEGEWVCHNLPFEQKFFQVHGNIQLPWERAHDTMVLAALDDPMRPKGLKPLADRLVDPTATQGQKALKEGMDKQGWTWGTVPINFPPYWVYAALDTVLTAHVFDKLHKPVTTYASEAYGLEMAALRVCVKMMLRGMKVDVAYIEEARRKFDVFSEQTRKWLKAAHGITSPNSGGQISRALTRLGCEITKFTDAGMPKMDKATLTFFEHHAPTQEGRQLAKYVLAIRHAEKMRGTYLDNFLELRDAGDIIRASINTLAARTGRMSVTDPALQTLPRDDKVIRGSFIPREGFYLATCDLDQIEARLGAHFSEDEGLIQAFWNADNGGADFFCGVASGIFAEEITDKKDPRRQTTKNVVYGCVPLTTRILTKRGWLTHDQVTTDDVTVGYDPADGTTKWTPITAVHHYSDADLVEVTVSGHTFVTTPNHRWYGMIRNGKYWEERFVNTDEFGPGVRILINGAPHDLSVDPKHRGDLVETWLDCGDAIFTDMAHEDVWCVTTGLGTWTMHQGDNARVITGNSLYGAGAAKMAETAGVPFEQMAPVKEAFDGTYPGLKLILQRLSDEAKLNDPPFIRSPFGRKLTLERGREYTQALNSLIQGHAAEYFKRSLVDMDAAGLGDNLLLPVHDEIIAEAPIADIDEVKRIIEECMTDRSGYRVPLTAGANVLTERWEKR